MNRIKRALALAAVLSLLAVAAVALPGTLALITNRTQPLKNTFLPDYDAIRENAVTVTVHKTMRNTGAESMGPEGFAFTLTDKKTGEAITATTDKTGTATFALDAGKLAGKTTFTLAEVNDGRAGVTYSTKTYTVEVIPAAGEKIDPTVKLDGVEMGTACAAAFENIYVSSEAKVPHTGDDSNAATYVIVLIVCVLCAAGLRTRRKKHE